MEVRLLSYMVILCLAGMVSCNDDDPPIICSCEGTGQTPFQDVEGIVVNTTDGYFLLSPYEGFYMPCAGIDSAHQIDGLMVFINGIAKATCAKPGDIYAEQEQNYSIIDTLITSTDSLFNQPPYEIHIIKSEDYGESEGFGYSITETSTGFKIVQTIIPAIGGRKTFKTSTDAFKTAVLVAYKLNLDIGLPSLTIQDLEFLQVLY